MMDWLSRGERQTRRGKRRWQILGFFLLGVALAVYWFDRRTANAFEHADDLNLNPPAKSTSGQDQQSANWSTSAAGPMTSTTTASAMTASTPGAGSGASGISASSNDREEAQEPNTAEEDETIVQGETGQLAGIRSTGATETSGDAESPDATNVRSEPGAQTVETGPVPTITDGSIQGNGTHDCPDGFPIKGNASSRIYHLPGESSYDATVPEVCFATEEDATSAGYRPRKR